jgi:hypothetical protein
MTIVSFAYAHALRARRHAIYAPPELNISAHGKALINNNLYYITENHIKLDILYSYKNLFDLI